MSIQSLPVEVFSTCPPSSAVAPQDYLKNVIDVARWSEQNGCTGILVYTDNSLVDPWLVSQVIIQNTEALSPLVAVQPVYMHPYTVAKKISTFGYLYGRRMYLNMVAGGFKNDLFMLNDQTPHDRRYDRLIEYTRIIKALLSDSSPVSSCGEFYTVRTLKMTPPLSPELFPGILVSGSSEAGLAAAKAIGATAVQYPKPVNEYDGGAPGDIEQAGVRIGIIAREDEDTAWAIAHERFPEDRKGQLTHKLAMKTSDSVWHKQLSNLGENQATERNPYWLTPFQNYKTFCPYLVGSYQRVADELTGYIVAGYTKFILDIPPSEEELQHIGVVFENVSMEAVA